MTNDRTPKIIIYHTTGKDKDQAVSDFMAVHAERVSLNSTISGMPKMALPVAMPISEPINAGIKTPGGIAAIELTEEVKNELFEEEPETLEAAYSDDDPFSAGE